jgi:hypothetical protein
MDHGNTHSGHFVLDNSTLLKWFISMVAQLVFETIVYDSSSMDYRNIHSERSVLE